ncbi:tetratricopeptide repeat protein [Trichocoleus sp. FACHB-591]|uniref:tetratricopeptide repeat protein n=1 Tax=Trichocoleus sp. FACHB-591 TaxID=2692872 RepID=UPI0016872391|nr:tetratricopeptide repeat protein [Trichocoleus sp. FACHB-591]MBD2096293.1 tetratricopeptide repeat protein [Trichocoleus sp. FACHB-591]
MNVSRLANEAQDLLSQAQYNQAIALLNQALQQLHDHPELYNLLASAYVQQDQLPEAIACYHKALELNPLSPETHKNLGNAWLKQRDFVNAIACYQKAIELDPDYATAYYNLGLIFQRQNQLEGAIAHYRRAIELNPTDAAAHNNLGLALQSNNQPEAAIACYTKLLTIESDNSITYYNLGYISQAQGKLEAARYYYQKALNLNSCDITTLNNLGFILNELGQYEEAISVLQQALQLNPDYTNALTNLGIAYIQLGKLEEGVLVLQKSLTLDSSQVEAYVNLGIAYERQDHFEEAITFQQQALALNPNHASAHNNLGVALEQQGEFSEALVCYEQAIQLEPKRASQHWNRSLLLLRTGHLEVGFAEFEARWQMKAIAPRSFPQPLWDGTNLEGRSILLHSEGGFGDTLQFVRYAPLVAERGGSVKIVCPQPLVRLLSSLPNIEQVVSWESGLPDFDVHAPLLSLPHLFGTSLGNIPANIPYLSPPEIFPFTLQSTANTSLKVGLTWGGNPEYGRDRSRSCSLDQFLPLLEIVKIAFYSLQKGPKATELIEFPREIAIQNLGDRIHDFSDTAAAIAQLDLVITTDTSVAHLAGALGCPVWVLLNFVPDWRWFTDSDRSPWYPSMRLFRQTTLGNWSDVFVRVNQALQDFVKK